MIDAYRTTNGMVRSYQNYYTQDSYRLKQMSLDEYIDDLNTNPTWEVCIAHNLNSILMVVIYE